MIDEVSAVVESNMSDYRKTGVIEVPQKFRSQQTAGSAREGLI